MGSKQISLIPNKEGSLSLKSISLTNSPIRLLGAAEVGARPDGLRPNRIAARHQPLADSNLLECAACPSGVRLALQSDTTAIELDIATQPCGLASYPAELAVTVDYEVHQTVDLAAAAPQTLRFTDLPQGGKRIEIYLPQIWPVLITAVRIEDGGSLTEPETRPRWITYGSSITHCGQADGPANTWPALVARHNRLDLWNMGFGSNGMMDTAAARTIAETPAAAISLKLAVNAFGNYDERTFLSAAQALVLAIRDRQPDVPILIVSPVCCPHLETAPSRTGITLQRMRELDEELVARMQAYGHSKIGYLDGLKLFGPDDVQLLHPEGNIHPNAQAQYLIADRFSTQAFAPGGLFQSVSA